MRTGTKGIEIILHFESLKLEAYLDQIGKPTIGYGTVIYPNGEPVKLGDKCTKEQARLYFEHDLMSKEKDVKRWLGNKVSDLDQNQFDALVSFAYNAGYGKTLFSYAKMGASNEIMEGAFAMYNKVTIKGKKVVSNGLTRRRKAEAHLWSFNEVKFFEK